VIVKIDRPEMNEISVDNPPPGQYIQVGEQQVVLPDGVTVNDWALERVRVQNPRIRAYLGCIHLLEETLESNYSILHCSAARLLEIWRKVRKVCRLIQTNVAPALAEPSCIPDLDTARRNALFSYYALNSTVINRIERYPYRIDSDQLPAIRRLLCISIGKIYAFLRDTFGEILANDPRSIHDSDYYLSRKFPHDIEEAEWLYATVDRLNDYLQGLGEVWSHQIENLTRTMVTELTLPSRKSWEEIELFLNLVIEGLSPKLKEVLALAGVRYDELEPLDGYTFDVPHNCKLILEVYSVGRNTVDRLQARPADSLEAREQHIEDIIACHATSCERLVHLLTDVDQALRDLQAYVPIWLDAIERRRALMLTRRREEVPPLLDGSPRRSVG
jgi:hypothetical protein